MHFEISFYIVGTKGNNVAVDVLVAVDDSIKAEFEGHAAVAELVEVQTVTETGSFDA